MDQTQCNPGDWDPVQPSFNQLALKDCIFTVNSAAAQIVTYGQQVELTQAGKHPLFSSAYLYKSMPYPPCADDGIIANDLNIT